MPENVLPQELNSSTLKSYAEYLRIDEEVSDCPVEFIKQELYGIPWKRQIEIARAVKENPKVSVRACFNSGKSWLAARLVLWFLRVHRPCKVITTAPTTRQVEAILWKELSTAYLVHPELFPGVPLTKKFELAPDWFALGFSSDQPVNFQGFHSERMFVVGDEAAGLDEEVVKSLKGLLSGEFSRLLFIGNPDDPEGAFFESQRDPKFKPFKISAFDTPNFTEFEITLADIQNKTWKEKVTARLPYPMLVTPQWVEDTIDEEGEDSPYVISRVFGDFPAVSIDKLIHLLWVEEAQKRELRANGQIQYGVDPAEYGDSKTILCVRQGSVVLDMFSFSKLDPIEVADWTEGIVRTFDPEGQIKVDAIGVGSGTAAKLIHDGYNAVAIKVSETLGEQDADKDKYINKRAAYYWNLRELFRKGNIAGKIDNETKSQLTKIKYEYKTGKLKIQSKEEMLKGGLRSPDKAEALMLAFIDISQLAVEEQEDFEIIYEDSYAKEGKF